MVEQPLGLITRAERLIGNKIGLLLDFVKRQWRRLLLALPVCWPLCSMGRKPPPMIDAQLERFADAILASVDKDAACRLASRHSSNLPCQVESVQRGSYNISICLDFFEKIPKRLLRIPLQPSVRDAWMKVESEAATLEYLREHTSVAVSTVWAYGKDARVMGDLSATHPYLLCDYIPGQSLTSKQVFDATSEQRVKLFSDIINVYAQFFKLRFPIAGSLLPGTQKHPSPRFGGLLSMSRNELQLIASIEPPKPEIVYSAETYLQHRLETVSESARLPLIDTTLEEVREQVFALYHFKLKAIEIMRSMQSADSDTFILAHPDLHYANIIVDEGLEIRGIIDWECAGTIPQYLFTPPAWITGHDGRGILCPPRRINDDFRTALELSEHEELKNHWRLREESAMHLATAHILCHPNKLERLFYQEIFPEMFTGSRDDVVSRFFADDKNAVLAEEVDPQLRASEQFTLYLKESGLYADIEEERARSAEIRAKIMKLLWPDK